MIEEMQRELARKIAGARGHIEEMRQRAQQMELPEGFPVAECLAELESTLEALSQCSEELARRGDALQLAQDALRSSEQRFLEFMRHLPGVAFIKDGDGRYLYVSDSGGLLLDRRPAEFLGKTDEEVWPAAMAAQVRASDQFVIRHNQVLQGTEIITGREGPRHWLVTKFPILAPDGSVAMVGGVALDVTEQRRAEAELRELQQVAHQRERLADIGAITAQIVHDMGNPLSGIAMQAQLILHRARRDMDQPVSNILEPVEHILADLGRLDAFIKAFMDFSREQRLDLRAVDLGHFLDRVVRAWETRASVLAIDLSLDMPDDTPSIMMDEEQLRRVFDSLLENALEAIGTGPGRIRINVDEIADDHLRISVEDTGPGIPAGVPIFRMFETTKPGGSGLGLSIAKQIIQAHGGSITHAGVQPHGTVFHLSLPRRLNPVRRSC